MHRTHQSEGKDAAFPLDCYYFLLSLSFPLHPKAFLTQTCMWAAPWETIMVKLNRHPWPYPNEQKSLESVTPKAFFVSIQVMHKMQNANFGTVNECLTSGVNEDSQHWNMHSTISDPVSPIHWGLKGSKWAKNKINVMIIATIMLNYTKTAQQLKNMNKRNKWSNQVGSPFSHK